MSNIPMNYSFGSDGGEGIILNFTSDDSRLIKNDWIPFASASTKIVFPDKKNKICGMSYGYMANRKELITQKAQRSQELMYQLNNNWVSLSVVNYQKAFYSTEIYADYMRTPTDRDIEIFVKKAHLNKVKVCLKPMVELEDHMWRAHIGFPDLNLEDMDVYWRKWFISYKHFLLHYAELAQELGIEMFCIGCEMLGTEHRQYDWLYLIDEIRRVYSGKIVYSTNHDREDSQSWFDQLDYIGTSAYYPVGGISKTYEEMVQEWTKVKWRLNAIAESRNKQYIFMEIGCRSVEDASSHPWEFNEDLKWNEQEQYNFYKSCFDVFMNEPNFAGVFWWDWPTYQYETREEAEKNRDFNIHLKKTEKLVQQVYKNYAKK